MSSTLGIIEIPSKSSVSRADGIRLASRLIGGSPLLDWVVRRVTESQLLDRTVVLLDPAQSAALSGRMPGAVAPFTSNLPDPLSRIAAACREFKATDFVRVPLNCPFVDPAMIDRLIATAHARHEYDYVGYCVAGGKPASLSRLGVFAEWCRAEAICQANESARTAGERAEVSQFMLSHAQSFSLRLIPVPAELDRPDLRLTISGEEDWENASTILDALGPDQLDWQTIVHLLEQQPELRKRMADLNRADTRDQQPVQT